MTEIRKWMGRAVTCAASARCRSTVLALLLIAASGGHAPAQDIAVPRTSTPGHHRGDLRGTGSDSASLNANSIRPGRVAVFGAVGTIDGARLGVRIAAVPAFTFRAAAGYVRVALMREGGHREGTGGASFSLGASWFTHPDAVVRPMLSLSAIYVITGPVLDGERQQRFALVPAIGSEYSFLDGFSLFFRFGPAFQVTMDPAEDRFELLTQFDAGLIVRL